jgi:PAS domain S-box-containing protein
MIDNQVKWYHSLRSSLLFWFMLLSIIPLATLSWISYQNSAKNLEKIAHEELAHTADLSQRFIDNWFYYRLNDISSWSQSHAPTSLLENLNQMYTQSNQKLKDFVKSYAYAKILDDRVKDLTVISHQYDYIYDIFLINFEGDILLSLTHESDLGTSLQDGPYASTKFANTFRKTLLDGKVHFSDLERYVPSANILASFITAPLIDDRGEVIGVFAVQLKLARIFDALDSIESSSLTHYMIGEDGYARSAINTDEDILNLYLDGIQFKKWQQEHISGKETHSHGENVISYKNTFGVDVLGTHRDIEIFGLHWVLISEIEKAVMLSGVYDFGKIVLAVVLVLLFIVLIIAYIVSLKITKPIIKLAAASQNVSMGYRDNLDLDLKSKSELGIMANAFTEMLHGLSNTERKIQEGSDETRKALRALNEQKYALDNHAIVAITDVDGVITFVNQRFVEISGYTEDELLGQNHRILNSGFHSFEFWENMYTSLQKGESWHAEVCNQTKSGERYWIDTTVIPFFNDDGSIEKYIAIRTDITKEKLNQLKLKENEERLNLVLQNTGVGIWDWNIESGETIFNERWAEIMGYTLEELAPINVQTWISNTHPDDLENSGQALELYWSGKSDIYTCEARMKHKDGHWVWVLDTGKTTEFTKDGNPLRMIGTHIDISENKRQEEKILSALSLTEATLESTDNGILVTSEFGKVLRTNSRFAELWNIPQSLIQTDDEKVMLDYVLDQLIDPNAFIEGVETIHSSESEVNDILDFKDGRTFERLSRPMYIEAKNAGRVWSFRDISEKIKSQKVLIEAKELAEDTVRAKSDFLASMSHEIRTPMNGVIGMLGLLINSNLDDSQRHQAYIAQSSANSLLTLINDILDFSKVEAGKLDLEYLDFNLRNELGDFAEAIAFKAQEKGVELILDVTGIERTMVNTDPGRLRQILTNLVGNAIKFTERGEVLISATLDIIEGDNANLTINVKDTGIGIPEDKIEHLFDQFTQVDASTTRKYGGTGLGLSIAKKLSELMGGGIEVSSELGVGSIFSFNIAIKIAQSSTLVMPQVSLQDKRVLFVDDNETNRLVLKSQLEQWGMQVDLAQSAGDGLRMCLEKSRDGYTFPYDIAFLDMQMPDMDGAEMGKHIRNNSDYDQMKMVMMTSLGSRGDVDTFAKIGFDAFFPKPTTTNDLFGALNVLIENGDALDEADPIVTKDYLATLGEAKNEWPKETRLLIVDDNRTNQLVANGILESFNLSADVANNGIEAIEMLKRAQSNIPYSLIMMDCQMPMMDGYEASTRIKQGEAGEDNKSVPIIAMTANAMSGDREKCIASGMDDYIVKPINTKELYKMLMTWLLENEAEVDIHQEITSNSNLEDEIVRWDRADALERVGGLEKILYKILIVFLKDLAQNREQLIKSIETLDKNGIEMSLHSIKGASANMSANKVQKLVEKLELDVKTDGFDISQIDIELLLSEIESLEMIIQGELNG